MTGHDVLARRGGSRGWGRAPRRRGAPSGRTGTRAAWGAGALAAALLVGAAPRAGQAAPGPRSARARCEVVIISARRAPGPLPAKLARFRADLRGGPFKRFGSFAWLGTRSLTMGTAGRSRLRLVGPYRIEARLLGRVDRPRRAARVRFELFLFRRRPGRPDRQLLRTRLLSSPGATVLLAGPRYRKGRLVFALTCR